MENLYRNETYRRSTYRNAHKDENHAAGYDATFRENSLKGIMWRLEQAALDDVLHRHFAGRRVQALDFACGTGRIASFLESRHASGACVDLSPAMLAHARQKVCAFELIEADLTQRDVLGDRTFDLVTAFRFFPNAEPALRRAALKVLVRHMAPGACLVFNNHLNHSSIQLRLLRLFRRPDAAFSMTQEEVDRLIREAGLKVTAVYAIGLLPATIRHLYVPVRVVAAFERAASKIGRFRSLFQDLIFVCTKDDGSGTGTTTTTTGAEFLPRG